MKKAALYVRVSTDAQFEDGYSVDVQKELLGAYCVAKQIPDPEFYVDGGFSGSHLDRPAMQRMIGDIRAGKISHVVVYKLDRLSRSQKDTLFLIEDVFNAHGVGFSSLNENFDTTTPVGKAMLGMMSVFAQLERETIRERTRMGMAARVKEGLWPGGGHPPFGYDYDEEKGILVPNGQAETVRACFRMFLAGKSADSIAREMGFSYDLTVRNMLSRITYTGQIEYNGQIYPGKHEAIISPEMFQRTRQEISRRSGGRSRDEGYLLSGLLECGVCGAGMRYQKWGKAGVKLVCYSQQRSKGYLVRDENCDQEKLWAQDVEKQVIRLLRERTVRHKNKQDDTAPERPDYAAQIRRENIKLARLYELYADGDDTLADVIAEKKKNILRLKEMEEQAQTQEKEKKTARQDAEKMADILSAWDVLTQAEKRAVIRTCIQRVRVRHDNIDVDFLL